MNTAKNEDGVTNLETVDPVPKLLELLPSKLSDELSDVGRTHLITHHIDTGEHRPVRQPLHQHPVAYLEAIDGYVEQLLEKDIIEPSAGPWSKNIVVVK